MKFEKKEFHFLVLFTINTALLLFWGFLFFWLLKYEIFWEPIEFLLYLSMIIVISFIPSYFFIKTIIKIMKQPKERIRVQKKFIIISLFILLIFSSFSILIIFLYSFPSAGFYINHDSGPYLIWKDDPKTKITIIWTTEELSGSELEYGNDINDMKTVYGNYDKRHVINLEDLEPGITYFYKIPSFSNKIYRFTTAPAGVKPFSFVVVGDNRNSGGTDNSNYGRVINAMSPYDYNFIINVGDICYDGNDFESWYEFFSNMEKHANNHPYMIAIGNHEYGDDFFATNFKYFFPYDYKSPTAHYYSFDYSNAHFLMIDNFDNPLSGGHYVSDLQLEWIKRDLAMNQDKWLFVALHVPPYSTGDFNMDEKLITQLCPIFYEYEVDVVLTGHDHHYEAFWVNRTENWGGTYYFISGGGGATLDTFIMERENNPWKNYYHRASVHPYQHDYVTLHDQIYGEITHQFMHFEISGSSLHVQAIRDDGTLIHEFNIRK